MRRAKYENSVEYFMARCSQEGNVGIWALSLFNTCCAHRNATAGKITQIKDVEAVLAAARFWQDKNLSASQVVQEYLEHIGGKPVCAVSLLSGACKRSEEIYAKIEKAAAAVQLMGADLVTAEDRAIAGSASAMMEYEGALAYAHQALRGCAGSLDSGPAQLEVLRSYLRDIKPWLRCCLSGYDPIVMERWGTKAKGELATRLDLANVLRQRGFDVTPILKHND
jgi:hypothetical protein